MNATNRSRPEVDLKDAKPSAPIFALRSLVRTLDVAGCRKLWAALAPEIPNLRARAIHTYGWENGRKLNYVPSHEIFECLESEIWGNFMNARCKLVKTGRKVSSPVYHSGFTTEYRLINETWSDYSEVHAVCLRVLARFYA